MPHFQSPLLRFFFWTLFCGFSGAILVIAAAFLYLSPKLPSVDVLRDMQLQTPLRIYTSDEQLIGEFGEKLRTPVTFEQIPKQFVQAILSAEDDRFYQHHGVDFKGLLRAAVQLAVSGHIQSGGSTITMQVAKNYFLTRERTFSRKFNEILLALQIERELTKNEILELYLNKIFLGHRAYGISAAARVYYGKPLDELSLAQLAMLAGLPKAPSAYNPITNPERAKTRRDWILSRMLHLQLIDQTAYQSAISAPVTATYHGAKLSDDAPHIADMARQEMLDRFGSNAYTDGYRVFTTIDSRLQKTARQAVHAGIAAYDQRHGYRGPEQQLPSESAENSNWQETLRTTPVVANTHPAIVSAISEDTLTVLLKSGESVDINWEEQAANLRPYVNVDRRGRTPTTPNELFAMGDLIRLTQSDDQQWRITQLPDIEAAMVALNASNGAILSMIGGFDYHQSKFNRITQATRQPGSNFKPFIYAAALENGFTVGSVINDAPIVFDDEQLESSWRPTNASGRFFGPTRLREALFKSRNLVSIRLMRALGINNAIDYVGRFGFDTSRLPKDLSLALGSHSLTPLEIATGYAALANGGYKVTPYLIDRIESLDGEIIYQAMPATVCHDCKANEAGRDDNDLADLETEPALDGELSMEEILSAPSDTPASATPPQAPRIIEERVAYIMDSMLKDVVTRGTARRARALNRNDLAGKTGTTNGPTDAWFSGYGGGIAATTWLGFDQNSVLGRREYGGSAALPIWIDFMQEALKDRPEQHPPRPEGLVNVKIDPATGLRAKPGQSDAIFEIFRVENAPQEAAEEPLDGDLLLSPQAAEEELF